LLISTIRAAIVDFERKKGLLKKLAESERALRYLDEATFRFQTVAEGDQIAVFIANECPNPQEAIYISELFSNAVEHGNAALTYEEKTELISRNLLAKEIEARLSLPNNKDKYVEVKFKRNTECLCIQIADMGKGFNYNKYLQFDDTRIFDNHGRGIAILNALFPVHFMGPTAIKYWLKSHLEDRQNMGKASGIQHTLFLVNNCMFVLTCLRAFNANEYF
jgi:hypothetical protein